ncbi:LysE family translocator [Paracoccus saliphilus]|uniref:LysE family translocator n=1 Tax=Paracoccus saliphilus TaxID=405559 RepID=A0AA45W205_9RHOB|nr:LysE family translocator [Paracoccus saliphilus]WCR01795.1 LysE family translocator [Paracoccus saliphilus]SIS63475.1 Threonine/homoserine/homoserine lactone efflux protein [Paracoccus saliphilus]
MSFEYLLTAFIVCVVPGLGVIYTLSSTLGGGMRAGLWAALGCTIATVIHMLVAMAGLAALLHTSALLFQAVKFAGVAYLLWMAWGALQGSGGLQFGAGEPTPAGRLVWRGVLLNLLNPKLPMFFMAFLPQFLPVGAGLGALLELGLGFAGMTFGVFVIYAGLAASGRDALLASERAMRWMRRIFAASFAMLGLKLAVSRA